MSYDEPQPQPTPVPDATDAPAPETVDPPETEKKHGVKTEQFEVAGKKLGDTIKNIMEEGNVRRIILKNHKGRVLLEIPLNAGVAVTAVTAIFAPWAVAIGAIAAITTSVSIIVERDVPADEDTPSAE